MTRTSPPRCSKRRRLMSPVVMICPPPMRRDAPDRDEHAALAGDLDDEADHARRVVLAVHDEDVAHLADPIARGVEDGAPGESGDEDSRGAHATNLAPGGRDPGPLGARSDARGRMAG